MTNTISRGDEEAREDFERFGVSDLIDHVVSSYSTGWEKPHRAIFERALGLAGAVTSAIDPATPDGIVASLRELPGVLDRWLHDDGR